MELKRHIIAVLLLLLGTLFIPAVSTAQVVIRDQAENEVLRSAPLETLYAHTSATLLFPGEYLYFSLYCIDLQTYRLSAASALAYVQLTGEDGGVYLRKKIRLRGGRGQGELFIGTEIPSGAYKLVAYSNWMRNGGRQQVFMADVTVINPYRQDQSALLGDVPGPEGVQGENPATALPGPDSAPPDRPGTRVGADGLELETDTAVYGPREWVTLRLRNYRGARGYGHYSVSIGKVPDLPALPALTAEAYSERYPDMFRRIPQGVGDTVALPEQRGELIGGQLFGSRGEKPIADAWLALSFPGDNFQLKMAQTDPLGRFFAYLVTPFSGSKWIAQVLDSTQGSYTIRAFSAWENFEPENFRSIAIDSSMYGAVRQRSIHNQIANSYNEITPDTVVAPGEEDPYFGEIPTVYNLDEFTRFPSLRETLVEIVQHVWIRREADGSRTFWVRAPLDPAGSEYTEDPPLVTVDGVLVADHDVLLDFDARRIRRIRVLREKKRLENRTYQGMVAIETIGGDFADYWSSPSGQVFPYNPPAPVKRYFRQGEGPSHHPDFRYQLLWEPRVELETQMLEYRFRTSDVPGTYQIRLEGFTTYGKPVTLVGYLQVSERE